MEVSGCVKRLCPKLGVKRAFDGHGAFVQHMGVNHSRLDIFVPGSSWTVQISPTATQKLAQDPRFIGGQVGMVGILHTLRLHSRQALGTNPDLSPACALLGACRWGGQKRQLVTCQERLSAAGQSAGQDFSGQVPAGIAKDSLL